MACAREESNREFGVVFVIFKQWFIATGTFQVTRTERNGTFGSIHLVLQMTSKSTEGSNKEVRILNQGRDFTVRLRQATSERVLFRPCLCLGGLRGELTQADESPSSGATAGASRSRASRMARTKKRDRSHLSHHGRVEEFIQKGSGRTSSSSSSSSSMSPGPFVLTGEPYRRRCTIVERRGVGKVGWV